MTIDDLEKHRNVIHNISVPEAIQYLFGEINYESNYRSIKLLYLSLLH